MATELTVVLRFESEPPTEEDLEYVLDCTVVEYEEEEV